MNRGVARHTVRPIEDESEETKMVVTVRRAMAALGVAIALGVAPAAALADPPARGTVQHQEIVIVKSIDTASPMAP